MKLSPTQVNQTLGQFDAQVIPEDHPSVPQLNGVFGDHTYFVNGDGLSVVEPAQATEGNGGTGQVVKVASWSDDTHSQLAPHEPEPTGVIVALEPVS